MIDPIPGVNSFKKEIANQDPEGNQPGNRNQIIKIHFFV